LTGSGCQFAQPVHHQAEHGAVGDLGFTANFDLTIPPLLRAQEERYKEIVKGTGFTLVEVLVALTIAIILSGILVLALNAGKQDALERVTASNMKQIASGIILYRTDNNEAVPPSWRHPAVSGYYKVPVQYLYAPQAKGLPASFQHGYVDMLEGFDMLKRNPEIVNRSADLSSIPEFDPDRDIWLRCLYVSDSPVNWPPTGQFGRLIDLENVGKKVLSVRPDSSVDLAFFVSCWEQAKLQDLETKVNHSGGNRCD
jgi:type II secretory pathway pseudopilin PulG